MSRAASPGGRRRRIAKTAMRGVVEAHAIGHMVRGKMIGPVAPRRLPDMIRAGRYGPLGGAVIVAGLRHGDRTAIVDELGSLTYAQLDRRSNALACALNARGAREGDTVGVLCRNHRGFLDITFAIAKIGGRAVNLNTDFAGPQLREVCAREGVTLLVHDEEYLEMLEGFEAKHGRLIAWTDGEPGPDGLETLIAQFDGQVPRMPKERASIVMLTSGTTGTPKGAPRPANSFSLVGALLSTIPFRGRESTYVAAPLFHALGFTQSIVAIGMGTKLVIDRRFKAEAALDAVARERCTAIVVVPVMLRRMVHLLEQEPGRYDTSTLRIVLVGGAHLDAELAKRALATFGDVIYNWYGSTEVAWATIAGPEDLRAAPGCAGGPPFGTTIRLFDEHDRPVLEPNKPGRIFVGNSFQFSGYTGGGTKQIIDGLMSTGDVGHLDEAGRLYVDGRDDDMIVSGGENVFPSEVEDLLSRHEAIEEASVLGVDDAEWGKRLAAFVVPKDGQELSEEAIKDYVRTNLARYKVPRDVTFLDDLPRNPSGKVLKRELRELLSTS